MFEKRTENRLFLICPTDHLEYPIRAQTTGVQYFYTALGTRFEYDNQSQMDLLGLIRAHEIEKVVYVSAINNVFLDKNVASEPPNLMDTGETDFTQHKQPSQVFFPNYYQMVVNHLSYQRVRLLSSSYVGSHLIQSRIEVKAYVFHPRRALFQSLVEIKRKACLFDHMSCN